ncbi:MAG: hypothetical protein JO025_26890 [Verrucomicrobia bacterium]|nr:hypothetical protein [Verrucomicrobiota bacterium]
MNFARIFRARARLFVRYVMWSRKRGQVWALAFDQLSDFVEDLSRRDYRTQPGVLTPGIDKKKSRPEGGGRTIAPDYMGVFKQTDDQNICRPFGAGLGLGTFLGLKPQAESCRPFGTEIHFGCG